MNRDIIERELQKIKTDIAEILLLLEKTEWCRIETVGVAAIVASIYSGYESVFINLCKNKPQKREYWHKELLKNAVAEGIVPLELEGILGEMLSFRHVQRNYYGHELRECDVRKKAIEIVTIVRVLEKHLSELL